MATHREKAEEVCRQIPAVGDDRILQLGLMHALLDVADAIRGHNGDVPNFAPVRTARDLAVAYAGYDGEHHKQHALVQVAELLGGRVPDGTDRGIPA